VPLSELSAAGMEFDSWKIDVNETGGSEDKEKAGRVYICTG